MTLASTSRRKRRSTVLAASLFVGLSSLAMPASAAGPDQAPAAASRWTLPPAIRRSAVPDQPSRMAQTLAAQGSMARAASVTPGLESPTARRADVARGGTPNVFGTVALAVARTPLDAKWQSAGAANAPGLDRWTAPLRHAVGNDEALLGEVNRWVNARVRFVNDDARGSPDRWAGAAETLRRGRGDCEDYALSKMQMLTALGFDSRRLFLVVVRDLVRRADHAVLVAHVGERYLVLDNMTDAVLDSNQVADYLPVFSYSTAGRWVHGYSRTPALPPVRIASLENAVAP